MFVVVAEIDAAYFSPAGHAKIEVLSLVFARRTNQMKTGLSLSELASEIERQANTKRDFIAPARELAMEAEPTGLAVRVNGHGSFGVNETAHAQFAERLSIPKTYYDRMLTQAPELLTSNVNHWLQAQPDRKMVRTLDGNIRAFLSDRYRPLDNFDLAECVLPAILQNNCRVESSALTERRLYIKAVTERLQADIKVGDTVQAGIVISNSEIGLGSIKVEPMIYRLVCSNGMISADHSMRKYHVGRNAGEGSLAEEFFKDATRRADDKAFWMKVRDVVEGSFREDVFNRLVDGMRDATQKQITGDPVKVVEVAQKHFGFTDSERGGILTHLIKGGDLSQYGLLNAVTRASQDVPDYDRATELERAGGQVIELSSKDWKAIAEAA
jgi:hypothetical protein